MAPIINVQWEYAARLSAKVDLLTTEVSRQNGRITGNQVTLAEIQQQLADGVNAVGGGMGWPLFKGGQYFKFTLPPNTAVKVVEGLTEPTLRQLRFRLLSGTEVYLSYSSQLIGGSYNPLQLNEGMLFQDDHDGGDEVWALSPGGATILVEIRTAEQSQQAGENFVLPFKAEPIIAAAYDPSGDGVTTLKGFNGNNANAFRCLDITSFHPGTVYTLTIEVDPAFAPWLVVEDTHPNGGNTPYNRYGSKVIEAYLPNLYANLPEMALRYLGNPPSDYGYGHSLIGQAKRNGWVASLPKDGGTISVSPDFSRRHLFLFARVSQYEPGDYGSGYAEAVSFTYSSATKTITITGT